MQLHGKYELQARLGAIDQSTPIPGGMVVLESGSAYALRLLLWRCWCSAREEVPGCYELRECHLHRMNDGGRLRGLTSEMPHP